jgi:hypothetical protein
MPEQIVVIGSAIALVGCAVLVYPELLSAISGGIVSPGSDSGM